jgi:fructokinase
MSTTTQTLCLGEAVLDLVSRPGSEPEEHLGGSMFNVARGIVNQGVPASLCSWWGRDEYGSRFVAAAAAAGVEVLPGTDGAVSTPQARATLNEEGVAEYEFDLTWDVPEIDAPERFGHVHTGSFAATLEPGGDKVFDLIRAVRSGATVSYDPNARPALMGSPDQVARRVEDMVSLCDVVKASEDDIAWLYPEMPLETVVRDWVGLGPGLVVITRGGQGALALLTNEPEVQYLSPLTVPVADTVGAGDSFMAGLLSALLENGLLGSADARRRLRRAKITDVLPALYRAIRTSAVTVSHAGSYSPTVAETDALMPVS